MAAEYYGRPVSIEEAFRACTPGRDGVSLARIADAAEQFGFRTLVARLSARHLSRVNLPCIAFWKNSHFVVIEEVKRRSVRVADPSLGRVTYSVKDFLAGWAQEADEGVVLLLEPAREFTPTKARSSTGLKFFLSYVTGRWGQVTQVLASILLGSVLQLMIAYTTRALVDVAIQLKSMSFVFVVLAAQLAMFVTRMFNDFLRAWIIVHLSAGTNFSILADFLKKVMHLPLAVFERRPIGDILQRVGDNARIQSFLTSTTVAGAAAIGNLVIFGVALFLLSRQIAFVFIATSALLAVWMSFYVPKRRRLDNLRFDQSAKLQTSLIQILNGARDIRLSTAERSKRESWERLQAKAFDLNLTTLTMTQWLQGGALGISQLRNILISCISAAEVVNGRMTLGTMLALAYMVGALSGPVDQIVSLFQSTQDAKISVDRVAEIHSTPSEIAPNRGISVPSDPDIALDRISFRYDSSSRNALCDLSLNIPHGARLAIVGPSGGGKTTLTKLLTKLYEPTSGVITIGGFPLGEIDTTAWRRRCGVVPQDGFIFSDTLAANIALGFDEAEDARLRHVIDVAVLGNVVKRLPEGVNSAIGQYGSELSAGERQRILIARALYKDPSIVILDEATSALDGGIERELLSNLDRELAGRTVITIAHRLSTVITADSIALLYAGVVVEYGSHSDLVSSKSAYYDLVRNQLEIAG
jgi:ATP-binding cassette, subfamily B, bacterial